MQNNNTPNPYQAIADALKGGRINRAIQLLEPLCAAPDDFDALDQYRQTYRLMSDFMLSGHPDADRLRVYSRLRDDLFTLSDKLRRQQSMPSDYRLYYASARTLSLRGETLDRLLADYSEAEAAASMCVSAVGLEDPQSASLLAQAEQRLDNVFEFLWSSGPLSSTTAKRLSELLADSSAGRQLKAQVISALTLGLLQFYDRRKLFVLIGVAESLDDTVMAARALPGILFALRKYAARVNADIVVKERFALWPESIVMYSRLKHAARQLLMTRDTDRVTDQMKKDVLPKLMDLKPDLLRRMRDFSADADLMQFEANPEWEETLRKSGLADHLKQLGDWQSEGADVMMLPFSNLKNFSYFNKVPHWFAPFTDGSSLVAGPGRDLERRLTQVLAANNSICSSDCYSLLLSLGVMPAQQRETVVNSFNAQMSMMSEASEGAGSALESSRDFVTELTLYMRDLYRFFNLFGRKGDFYNPFATPANLTGMPVVGEILRNDEIINLIAEFYFERGLYADALPYLETILDEDKSRTDLYEKIGFCHQSQGDSEGALQWYDKALSANGESQWLLKKLAHLHKLKGDFAKAAVYYTKALANEPDNMTLLLNTGHAQYECGNVAEALRHYYKAQYLHPDSLNPVRAIAWCEMVSGHYDKALPHYERVLLAGPGQRDYITAGHLQFLSGNYSAARDLYVQAVASADIDRLRAEVDKDMAAVPGLAERKTEMGILLDSIGS